jgi:DNA polymerase-1
MRRTVIIDGHNFLFPKILGKTRGDGPNRSSVDSYTVYAVLKDIVKVIQWAKATRVVLCWDCGKSRRRLKILPTYKSGRTPLEKPVKKTANFAMRCLTVLLKNLNVHVIRRKKYSEADDWVAAICHVLKGKIFIASTDSDFYQLITDRIVCLNPQKLRVTDTAKLKEKLSITPSQYVEWKSIVGDTSDAIPGVPGVGPTLASRLLSSFKTALEAKRARNSTHFDKRTSKVFEHGKIIRRNKKLIGLTEELDKHVPLVKRDMRKPLEFNPGKVKRMLGVLSIRFMFRRKSFFPVFERLR